MRRARFLAIRQITGDSRAATRAPQSYLASGLRRMGVDPRESVAMMTGADVARAGYAVEHGGALAAAAWCTAGCSNALRIGDDATAESVGPATVNLIVVVNQALAPAALAEALQLAVEARVVAMLEAGVRSTLSGHPATGTGTDCVAIAAPAQRRAHRYCGKHTRLGEIIGRAALRACALALARRPSA
jgi:adenosylcobinamide kinase/adenosylcobinamide-phosphate guanylyltransferase